MRKTITTLATAACALALAAPTVGATTTGTATISGTVGENVSDTDDYDGRHLRHVGNPAPDGYSPWYQWGEPYVLTTSPEDGPVTMSGTIDVADMTTAGQVAIIGLHDADALGAGDRGDKAEVGIYLARRSDGTLTVGVTDGDAGGGEFVQAFTTFAAVDLPDHTLEVTFTADGTADPASCATSADDLSTADGCMVLDVNGRTITDSYGTIVPTDITIETELGSGSHPGWYAAYPSGHGPNIGVDYTLTVSPTVVTAPTTADDCRDGGWQQWEFKNQGRCVASVQADDNAGK